MNAYVDFVQVSSDEMKRGLLSSVMKEEGSQPDHELIELYANTSSSPYLTEAFNKLKSETGVEEKRWLKEACDSAHKASKATCRSLLSGLSGSASWKSGGPRSICKKGMLCQLERKRYISVGESHKCCELLHECVCFGVY